MRLGRSFSQSRCSGAIFTQERDFTEKAYTGIKTTSLEFLNSSTYLSALEFLANPGFCDGSGCLSVHL